MKYNQPYGISDPNAPYINGDPSIGQAGSIPPAASIEYPQREIVNLITDTGLILPDNADLHQLAKAVQSGQLNYKPDTGLSNFYAATLVPNPGSYFDGLTVTLKIQNTNTGPAVLNLNGIGNAPIVRNDGTDVIAGDLREGSMATFVFDEGEAEFQLLTAASVAVGPPGPPGPPGDTGTPGTDGGGGWVWLAAPRTLYVNDATGNDTYDGFSAVWTDGIHGPFKTLQRAADEVRKYNLNGYNVTVMVAAGTYARVIQYDANGAGYINWIGDTVNTPPNVHINANGYCVLAGRSHTMDGFRYTSAAADGAGWPGWGIYGSPNSPFQLKRAYFSTCVAGCIAQGEGFIGIIGPIWIAGNCAYFAASDGGRIQLHAFTPPALTIVGSITISTAFFLAYNLGVIGSTFASITNAAGVTGKKYHAEGNGVINMNGSGVGYLPGSVAGTTASGGQYL